MNCCHILFNVFPNSLKCLCRVVPLIFNFLSVPCHFFVLSFWLEIESNINFVCIARMCFAAATNVYCASDSCNEESIDAQSLSYDKSRHVVQGQTLRCKDKCNINQPIPKIVNHSYCKGPFICTANVTIFLRVVPLIFLTLHVISSIGLNWTHF